MLLVLFSIATVSYSVNLYSVSVAHASVCKSRAVPTMLITVTQLDAVTQEVVLPREKVKRSCAHIASTLVPLTNRNFHACDYRKSALLRASHLDTNLFRCHWH